MSAEVVTLYKTNMRDPVATLQGPRPKGMGDTFQVFRRHIRRAMDSERARREAVAAMRGPVSGALVANGQECAGGRNKTVLKVAA